MKPARLPWRAPRARGRDARDPVAPATPRHRSLRSAGCRPRAASGSGRSPGPRTRQGHGVRRRLGHDVGRTVHAGRGQNGRGARRWSRCSRRGRCWPALGQPARVPAGGRPVLEPQAVTDITEHPTLEGKVYCAVVLDTFPRRVVGWSIDASPAAAPGRCPRQYRCVPREKHSWWRKR